MLTTVIEDRDRASFHATGSVSAERRRERDVDSGNLWIGELDELWVFLEDHPRLGDVADVYCGLQRGKQREGCSAVPKDGFERGVFTPRHSLLQYEITSTSFLDVDPERVLLPGPLTRKWDMPKVLASVARLSRGPWRMAAAIDREGLVPSQALFGIWSRVAAVPLEAIEGILKGPLANAYLTDHASSQHFTNRLVKQLPLPKRGSLEAVARAVRRYRELRLSSDELALGRPAADDPWNRSLVEVDAEVLKAYDLPPRLVRKLLECFRGQEHRRRVGHEFLGWLPEDFTACIPLHEYLGPLVERNRGPWVLEVFTAAPERESERLRQFVS